MKVDLARAWKDPEYRRSLTAEELASLPPPPAGSAELTVEELRVIAGGTVYATPDCSTTCGCWPVSTKDNCPKRVI
jgi:mersacidin/lichenicidin family type 2 lantibiotic